jgi:hypothetical protein
MLLFFGTYNTIERILFFWGTKTKKRKKDREERAKKDKRQDKSQGKEKGDI